jgi:uncharacterized membrane protein
VKITLGKHRVEGLTDGVFAIVMTLLVLELKVPELPKHVPNAELIEKLGEVAPHLFSFVLTFVLCALFWFLHHLSMQYIRHVTRPLIFLNLGFLLGVSLLPFSGALLGRFMHAPIALQIYYGHQFALSILLVVQWAYVRGAELLTDGISPADARILQFRLCVLPAGTLAAIATSLFRPEFAMLAFALTAAIVRLIVFRMK